MSVTQPVLNRKEVRNPENLILENVSLAMMLFQNIGFIEACQVQYIMQQPHKSLTRCHEGSGLIYARQCSPALCLLCEGTTQSAHKPIIYTIIIKKKHY